MLLVIRSCTVDTMAPGRPTTMPAKMISEMPLPIPLSEICSPSHMMKAVPVVRVRMVMSRKPRPGWTTTWGPPELPRFSSQNEIPSDWTTLRTTVP